MSQKHESPLGRWWRLLLHPSAWAPGARAWRWRRFERSFDAYVASTAEPRRTF